MRTLSEAARQSERDKAELNIREELALSIYLGVYRQLIDHVKPVMGMVEVDALLVSDVLDSMCYGDIVVDITDAIDVNTARPTLRSYISGAGTADRQIIWKQMMVILRSPATPAYFKGFRNQIATRLLVKIGKKSWGMGDIIRIPIIKQNELGATVTGASTRITVRLRD
uniref:Uncharacterized protein n=1 Tax=uncultured Thiotrichaceae bacterium TaxID=298394 RepID=A0A6S6UIE8_9GAMM|nr:MAG: Unknown protein [uncultured Thiotrichaceae bacterium]